MRNFLSTLRNYFDAGYYVDWAKALSVQRTYEKELALLSTLCGKADKEAAAVDLFTEYSQVIRVLPLLIAKRGRVTLVEGEQDSRTYDFATLTPQGAAKDAVRYARFAMDSGIMDLLEHIDSVRDYVTGIEVGMDTNGRKNRGGKCGVRAIEGVIRSISARLPGLMAKPEVSAGFPLGAGFKIPAECADLRWDFGFWKRGSPGHPVLMEINHYGSSGSKPPAIAREYTDRSLRLKEVGITFVWVTDGLGWMVMTVPLREAFTRMDNVMTVGLAKMGQLEYVLRRELGVQAHPRTI